MDTVKETPAKSKTPQKSKNDFFRREPPPVLKSIRVMASIRIEVKNVARELFPKEDKNKNKNSK
jgi:hypothetical protein